MNFWKRRSKRCGPTCRGDTRAATTTEGSKLTKAKIEFHNARVPGATTDGEEINHAFRAGFWFCDFSDHKIRRRVRLSLRRWRNAAALQQLDRPAADLSSDHMLARSAIHRAYPAAGNSASRYLAVCAATSSEPFHASVRMAQRLRLGRLR